MRAALLAIALLCSTVTSIIAQDDALRAFLGIRASRVELETPAKPRFYATTFAKFEKGQFVGFGHLGTGINQPQSARRYIELAWGASAGVVGYVLIDPLGSSSFTADPFFDNVTMSMTGKGLLPNHPQFRGFEVVGYAFSKDAQGIGSRVHLAADVLPEIQSFDKSVLLLYREFEKQEDYSRFLSEFKQAKTP